MRKFYLAYSVIDIYEKSSRKSKGRKYEKPSRKLVSANGQALPRFTLGWSHYLKLIRIDDLNERAFYEIEATKGHWSLRELQRQFDSSLYERLTLSRNKKRILELSRKGQVIEKPEDAMKDPLVLEFTGIPERAEYSESDLEQKLIDHIQEFMLELGKGFAFVGRQKRISFDERHFKVDLVFFNRILRCFVLCSSAPRRLRKRKYGIMCVVYACIPRQLLLQSTV